MAPPPPLPAPSAARRGRTERRFRLRAALAVLAAAGLFGCTDAGPLRDAGRAAGTAAALPGWDRDSQAEILPALQRSCAWFAGRPPAEALRYDTLTGSVADWQPICAAAAGLPAGDSAAVRRFFETWFVAVPVGSGGAGESGLFTGYYQPELRGSRQPSAVYRVPIHRPPAAARTGGVLPARAAIAAGALDGQGLELLWVDDPVDAFFLQVQGSGRVVLADGAAVQLGYAGNNGRPYSAIGRTLIERGAIPREAMSMQAIRDWLHAHPDQAQDLMNLNERYVFFEPRDGDGPVGAMGVPLTPGRSLAVDRSHLSFGVPLWLDLAGPTVPGGTLRRLVIAQDTGSAITGRVRGDLFWGHGEEAARRAGRMQAQGRYTMLVPRTTLARTRPAGS